MKPIVFSFFLGLLASQNVSAQKFEIGINAGASRNTAFQNKTKQDDMFISQVATKRWHPAISLKAIYNTEKWQFGITTGRNTVSGTYKISYPPNAHTLHTIAGTDRFVQITPQITAYQYIPVRLLVNKKINIGKVEMYGGIAAGIIKITHIHIGSSDVTQYQSQKEGLLNYSGGIQAGASYPLGKHIRINAEVAANITGLSKEFYVYSFPATGGISYRF